jgi:glycosyltransferase involved in cell wall biosynthesis
MKFKSNLFFNWGVGDHFGWGIYGLNLLYWSMLKGEMLPVPIVWPPSFRYQQDPITHYLLKEAESKWHTGVSAQEGDVMLSALGNTINKQVITKKMREIGVIFFEKNPLPLEEQIKLRDFELIIAGSSWNALALKEMGFHNTKTIIQGVNTELFRPRSKKVFLDRFVVFSGGKLEYRKGQDIALKAFSIFAQKYPEALLITAWRSDWEKTFSESVNQSNLCAPLKLQSDFKKSISIWIEGNRIKSSQYLLLDSISNAHMSDVYAEVDVALFPNRCEGGTNLVAMEAIRSGVTSMLSANTGHLDIIKQDNCIALMDQKRIDGDGALGWGESSIDEILFHLEQAYSLGGIDKTKASRSMASYTWNESINSLIQSISVR